MPNFNAPPIGAGHIGLNQVHDQTEVQWAQYSTISINQTVQKINAYMTCSLCNGIFLNGVSERFKSILK